MASGKLQGIRIAILVSDGYEELELIEPQRALEHSGASTFVVSSTKHISAMDKVEGADRGRRRQSVPVDIRLESARPEDFHALLLPGGSRNAEHLIANPKALEFAKEFMRTRKLVAAIGEAVELLRRIGVLGGRMVAAGTPLRRELENEGTICVDEGVVCDSNLITARSLNDVAALIQEMTRVLTGLREHSAGIRKLA